MRVKYAFFNLIIQKSEEVAQLNEKKETYEENQKNLDEFNERFEKVAADLEAAEV